MERAKYGAGQARREDEGKGEGKRRECRKVGAREKPRTKMSSGH